MTNPTSFARRRLVDEVIDHLRTEIASGRLLTGSRLPPEAKLTQQLGVSRTTLREAIVVLSHDGLVDVRQGDGTYVRPGQAASRPLADRSLGELLELRRPLQLEVSRLAAARRTEQEASHLRELTEELATALETRRGAGIPAAVRALEAAIGEASHSALLAEFALQASSAIEASAKPDYRSIEPWLAAFGHLVECARGVVSRNAESADRFARLWLAAQASVLQPAQQTIEYVGPEARRGPRASHAKHS